MILSDMLERFSPDFLFRAVDIAVLQLNRLFRINAPVAADQPWNRGNPYPYSRRLRLPH